MRLFLLCHHTQSKCWPQNPLHLSGQLSFRLVFILYTFNPCTKLGCDSSLGFGSVKKLDHLLEASRFLTFPVAGSSTHLMVLETRGRVHVLLQYSWMTDTNHWLPLSETEKVQLALRYLQELYPEVNIPEEYTLEVLVKKTF